MHGGKGIGFDLQDGDEDYSGEYGLMSGDRIDRDLIDMIPHYKESPLVQKAINDMEKYLNEKHGKVQEAEQTVEVKQKVSETPFKKESVSVEPNREQNKEPAKGGKGAVSYTHLDVYKRQSFCRSEDSFFCRSGISESFFRLTYEPVSYTHLMTIRQSMWMKLPVIFWKIKGTHWKTQK